MQDKVPRINLSKGAAYLFVEAITGIVSGYVFWLILSMIIGTETIGLSSTAFSLSAIFASIVLIGIPNGIQGFLGRSFHKGDLEKTRFLVTFSLLVVSAGTLSTTIILIIHSNWFEELFRFDFDLLIAFVLLIASSAIAALFRSIILASLQTRVLPIALISSAVLRLVLAVLLVAFGMGATGVILAISFSHILMSVIMGVTSLSSTLRPKINKEVIIPYAKKILSASISFWIPATISTIGSYLGTVVVFGLQGSNQAGVYFIAFTIVLGLSSVISVLSSVAYPAVSTMIDGRKRFIWRLIKISLITTAPLTSAIIFYSEEIMGIFGPDYEIGSFPLKILLLSVFPTAVINGITVLSYSYGSYTKVLEIGLASSIPRSALYFILVPIYGSEGAAISFFIGSATALIISNIMAKKIGFRIAWKDLTIIFIIPFVLALISERTGIHYVTGIIFTIILSYVLYIRLHIVSRYDLENAVSLLPDRISCPILNVITSIARRLNKSF